MEKEIKRCPFCGGEAEINKNFTNVWITCSCGIETKGFEASINFCAEDEAIKTWNRRVESDEPATEDITTGSWNRPPPTIGELSDMLKTSIYEIFDSLPYENEKRLDIMKSVTAVMREVIEFEKCVDFRQS